MIISPAPLRCCPDERYLRFRLFSDAHYYRSTSIRRLRYFDAIAPDFSMIIYLMPVIDYLSMSDLPLLIRFVAICERDVDVVSFDA